ncbi:hypothetical protein CBR_g51905 [Chara braunii]|uniref:Uncharacterized protein n=1 Tax=Chara braunii TaxID=69332 RepID=A0A388M9F7_CHABU|nr:hypothetical protein CBR_g51905 [Chara braunii]|eukprot:GBG91102.1 hypothetical protein CBR_g51905 [Chara braunii]
MAHSWHSMAAVAVCLAMAVLLRNDVAHIDAQDVPPEVSIDGVSFEGTGCDGSNPVLPGGLAPDKKSVTFNFTVILGVRRKSYCYIKLQLKSTDGWKLESAETIGRGFADLDAGVEGSHSLTTSISGLTLDPNESKKMTEILGPFTGNYEVNEKLFRHSEACTVENEVNIKSLLEVRGTEGAKGIMSVEVKIKWVWEAC